MERRKSGFTLIELIITITIIALLAGGGAVSLNNFNARQKVESAKEELLTNLKLARDYATSMQVPLGKTGTLKEVELHFDTSGLITAKANDVGGTYYAIDITPAGVDLAVSRNDFKFAAYKGSLVGTTAVTIILTSTEAGTSAVVDITSLGLIHER